MAALKRSPAHLVTDREVGDIDRQCVMDKSGARHGPFDLIVVADGAHSVLRTRLMPGATDRNHDACRPAHRLAFFGAARYRGRYSLESAAQRPGVSPKRAEK